MDSENFKNLFNAIHDFLFILDLKGNILEVNKAVQIFLGYENEDLKGKSVLLVHPPEYREKAAEIVGQMLSGLAEKCPLPLLSKSGKYIPVETKIYHGQWNNEKVLIGISRNMSEIALSEEKFFSVFDNSQALMAISEIESGIFVNVNKVFLEELGFEKSEIIGRNSKELNLFYDYKQRDILAEKTKNNSVIENEHIIIRTKDGRPLDCLFSVTRIQIQTYHYLLTSAINISSLVLSQKKLKKNLDQQRLLADISQSFLALDHFREKIRNTLKLLGEHTGVSRVYIFEDTSDSVFTCNTFEWCKPGVNPQINELRKVAYEVIPSWKKILTEKGKVFFTNSKDLPDDLITALEPLGIKSLLAFPLFVQNHIFGFIGFDECEHDKEWEEEEVELLRTISGIISNSFERQTFQKQLTESEIRQKLALENTEAGLWDWNIETGDVYYNDIWCKMLGYDPHEIEPNVRSWEQLLHPVDSASVFKELNKHLQGKTEFYHSTHRLLTKNGDWKWVIDKGKVIEFDENGKPKRAIGTYIDITNQKAIEQELRNLNATKDKLFSIIAHDLRGPIGTMMQISEMVTQGFMDKETLNNFLHSQKELTENTLQLLENLLNWARFNSERIQFQPKAINLNTIIDENLTSIKFRASQKGINLVSGFNDSFSAYADEDMVKLVIRNLLSNALKFTGRNGSISIDLQRREHTVEVKISDTGTGISEENIDKILSENVFYSTAGTANEKGSGLGLKLCRNFISQNKGKFRIESKINSGSCFIFTLPAAPVETCKE